MSAPPLHDGEPSAERSQLAVASLVLALLGVVGGLSLVLGSALIPFGGLLILGLPAAVVVGALALSRIGRAPSGQHDRGVAIAGIALAILGMVALVALLAALAFSFGEP